MLSPRSILPLLTAISAGWSASYLPRDIPVTRWVDDGSGSRPGTYQEWQQANPTSLTWKVNRRSYSGGGFDTKFDIIVNAVLYDSIRSGLDTFRADLVAEGFAVSVFSTSGGTPESLRAFLSSQYDSGMAGALFIGSLPVAWYQLIDDWDGDGVRDPSDGDVYEEFPCDLYYMDLNGVWEDTVHRYPGLDSLIPGRDGIWDRHSGDLAPEIWIGRITTRPCGNEKVLVSNYLRRAHAYRNGDIALNDRALVFVDDDWEQWAAEFYDNVGLLYPDRVLISDPETTQTTRYRQCLTENYQWIGLYSHSSPLLHGMKYNNGNSWSWFYESEVPTRNPVANFYNLFACSNARYTDTGYMGGRYIYSTTTGLNSVGSTKTGSMLDFANFYAPLGAGLRIGESFMAWFDAEASGGFDPVERSWFYGMCLNGDPTLKPHVPLHDVAVSGIVAPGGNVDSGTVITPVCRVVNNGLRDEVFPVRFRIGSSYDETRTKTLARGVSDTVAFPSWVAAPVGIVATRCSAGLSTDTRPENDAYSWWVTVRRLSGVTEKSLPSAVALMGAEPNPASNLAVVRYALPFAATVKLAVYDCQGSVVRSLVSGRQPAGRHSVGLDLTGEKLPAGVYLLRLEADGKTETKRLVVVR